LRSGDGCQPFVLCLFAGLATLWFVLQSFVMEESLFTRSPNESLSAVDTLDRAIGMFDF
jgi:hypothetical protein